MLYNLYSSSLLPQQNIQYLLDARPYALSH